MAFAVTEDQERQGQVWELLAHSYNRSGAYIRQKLTENSVRVADKRVRFVGVEAYVEAGGGVMRDLFEEDDGGWLTDPSLLDRLVTENFRSKARRSAPRAGSGSRPPSTCPGVLPTACARLTACQSRALPRRRRGSRNWRPRPRRSKRNGPTTRMCRTRCMSALLPSMSRSARWSSDR